MIMMNVAGSCPHRGARPLWQGEDPGESGACQGSRGIRILRGETKYHQTTHWFWSLRTIIPISCPATVIFYSPVDNSNILFCTRWPTTSLRTARRTSSARSGSRPPWRWGSALWAARAAPRTRRGTPGALRWSSTPRRATGTWSATTRPSSL